MHHRLIMNIVYQLIVYHHTHIQDNMKHNQVNIHHMYQMNNIFMFCICTQWKYCQRISKIWAKNSEQVDTAGMKQLIELCLKLFQMDSYTYQIKSYGLSKLVDFKVIWVIFMYFLLIFPLKYRWLSLLNTKQQKIM